MIILTNPIIVKIDLGGTKTAAYDHVVFSPLVMNPVDRVANSSVRVTASASPEQEAVMGELLINLGPGTLIFRIEQFGIFVKKTLSAPEINAIQTIINNTQNGMENGMIAAGLIVGTQSTGA